MKELPSRVPVVIVGAGPTGLAAANLLGQAGIETLVLERNDWLSDCPKAISIDDEGSRIWQAMGLGETLLNSILSDVQAHYVSGSHYLAKVAPTQRRNGYPLISTFYQPDFELALLNGLDRFSCVTIYFQHRVEQVEQDGRGVRLTVCTPGGTLQAIECSYLLACDGGKSPTRHMLNIPMHVPRLMNPGRAGLIRADTTAVRANKDAIRHTQKWLVVDCINDEDAQEAIIFFCNPNRPAVTVPAPGNRRRWEFMLLSGEREEDLLQPDTIRALIKESCAQPGPDIQRKDALQITRMAMYTFYEAIAARFSSKRIFLLGDAAHLMPPFGGQGMNSGLRDAHNLCWKIQMVLQGQADSRLLETYHQERYPHVAQMILFSSLLGKLIMPTRRPIAHLRDLFFRGLANNISPLRNALTEMKVKPQPRYRQGCMLSSTTKEGKTLVGALLPQPHVMDEQGRFLLLDDALGNGFSLLRLYEEPAKAFAPLKSEVWSTLRVRYICVQPARSVRNRNQDGDDPLDRSLPHRPSHDRPLVLVDSEQKLSAFLRHNQDLYILVRHDRYILGVFRPEEEDSFIQELTALL